MVAVTVAASRSAPASARNGRLVRPFAVSLRLAKSYWIVCPQAAASLPKIRTFRDWLLAEAAEDERRLKALRA